MPAVEIGQSLWNDLVAVAEKRRSQPERLAQRVLRDFVRQMADEELLTRSAVAARRAAFRIADTERVVRRHRRKSQ